MAVVAAGVHAAGTHGGIGQAGLFLDGKRVHVGAQRDGFLPARIEEGAETALQRRRDLGAERLEHAADVLQRFGKIEVELGNAVKRSAVKTDGISHGRTEKADDGN